MNGPRRQPKTCSRGNYFPTAFLTVSGSAVNGTDFSVNTVVAFGVNQTAVTIPVQAFNSALPLGWRTAVIAINNGSSSQVGQINLDRKLVRIQDPQNTTTDTDIDGDGLPDGFELDNGLDPVVADNPYVDADRDGIGLAEELELGTNPNVSDAPPVYPSIDDTDFVPLTLRVGSAGKMVEGNCAVCHEVTVRAGNFIRTSSKTGWDLNPAVAGEATFSL